MSITTDRIARKANGIGESVAPLDDNAKFHLFEALSSTLDSLVSGVIIVANQARILHANQAAQHMLDAKSPILSLAGRLCALQAERTKELQRAIAAAQADRNPLKAAASVFRSLTSMERPRAGMAPHASPFLFRDLISIPFRFRLIGDATQNRFSHTGPQPNGRKHRGFRGKI